MGLVPRHTGTGGRTRMLNISKNGDRELRNMMIHGARAVIRPRKSLSKDRGSIHRVGVQAAGDGSHHDAGSNQAP